MISKTKQKATICIKMDGRAV